MTDLNNLLTVYNKHYKGDVNLSVYEEDIKQWEDNYRGKIFNNTLEVSEYVDSADISPIKFLGYRAKLFVPLGGMRTSAYMIYKKSKDKSKVSETQEENPSDEDNEPNTEEYVVSDIYKNKNTQKVDPAKCFDDNIRPLLRLIVNAIDKNGFEGVNSDLKNVLLTSLKDTVKSRIEKLQDDKTSDENLKKALDAFKTKTNVNETVNELNTAVNDTVDELNTAKTNLETAKKNLEQKQQDNSNQEGGNTTKKKTKKSIKNKDEKIIEIDNIIKEIDKITESLGKLPNDIKPGLYALDLVQRTQYFKDFSGKQLLIKMMIMESVRDGCCEELKYKLPIITNFETINGLYEEFVGGENSDTLTSTFKAYTLLNKCVSVLAKDKNIDEYTKLISIGYLLWDYKEANILDVSENTPNVIYYGSPGTGKTYTVTRGIDIKLLSDNSGNDNLENIKRENDNLENIKKEYVKSVQCHPGFGYEEFIEGLKPVGFTSNGTLKLEPVNGTFKNLCIRARNNPGKNYYFVADEINRANLSAMFGETLSLLETDYRDFRKSSDNKRHTVETPMSQLIAVYFNEKIKTANGDKSELKEILDDIKEKVYECDLIFGKDDDNKCKLSDLYCDDKSKKTKAENLAENPDKLEKIENVEFGVPKNIYFIGMMNDVDKSIDAFDLALRRRFKWIRKDCSYNVLIRELYKIKGIDRKSTDKFCQACENLNNNISSGELNFGKPYEFGHAYFLKIKNYINANKQITEDSAKKLFSEHLEPVLREYIRSFKEESEIDKQIKKIKNIFLKTFKSKTPNADEETFVADGDSTVSND